MIDFGENVVIFCIFAESLDASFSTCFTSKSFRRGRIRRKKKVRCGSVLGPGGGNSGLSCSFLACLGLVLTPGKYSETSSASAVSAVVVSVDAVVDAFEVDSLSTCSGLVLFIYSNGWRKWINLSVGVVRGGYTAKLVGRFCS